MTELRERLLRALETNAYRGQWSSDHDTMLPLGWDADDVVDRVIADAELDTLERRVRAAEEMVGLATDELRNLVHTGWSSLAQKRALGQADALDRRARSLISGTKEPTDG